MKTLALDLFLKRPAADHDWVIFILVFTMLLIVLGRVLFSTNYDALGSVEKYSEVNDNQLIFGFLFHFSFAVLVSTVLYNYFISDYDYIFYLPIIKILAVTVFIFLFFALRFILGRIINYAFSVQNDRKLNTRVFNYYLAVSTFIVWIGVLLFYFSTIDKLFLLGGIAIILVIIRAVTYIEIIKNQSLQGGKVWYYNILYLCTLEILPVLVLFKFLIIGT